MLSSSAVAGGEVRKQLRRRGFDERGVECSVASSSGMEMAEVAA